MANLTHGRTTNPSCVQCRYCDPTTDLVLGQSSYVCRFNPPKVFAMPGMARPNEIQWMAGTFWPNVKASDWCSEHEPRFDS